jgi:hypothetical protein
MSANVRYIQLLKLMRYLMFYIYHFRSRSSSVGIARSYMLDGRGWILGRGKTGSGAYPASYKIATVCSFSGGEAGVTWN